MKKKRLTTTLLVGNMQGSDDIKNKPSNKGHQTGTGGSECERPWTI